MRVLPLLTISILAGAGSIGALQPQSPAGAPIGAPQNLGALDPGAGGAQNSLLGSVPGGALSAQPIPLSLSEAISRGLKFNLGVLLEEQNLRSAQGSRLKVLSELMPNLKARVSDTGQQINLAAFGFNGFPGVAPIVGPFNVFDTRLALSQTLLNFGAWNRSKAEVEKLKAEEHSRKNVRDLVVLTCGSLYLQATAGQSRIDSARAQLATAQALLVLATDRKNAGVAAGIDVLRAEVQLQAQQQRLIVAENDFAKQMLILARAIGLPLGQEFTLAEDVPYADFPVPGLDSALELAYRSRGDYLGALDLIKAAELRKKSEVGKGRPSLDLDAAYGLIGQRVDQNHGTFAVAASLNIPIFEGGKVRGEVLEADAALRRRQAEADELRARIYYEIRSSFLDLQSARDRVKVAQGARTLAEEQLRQSKDRFAAGVTNTIEVVQSQEALATASENYISSLFAFNLAKASLARGLGIGEDAYLQFLRGKP